MPLSKIIYDNTYFYKIVCKNLDLNDLYIGHTTNFRSRKWQHKSACNNEANKDHNAPVYKFIRKNGGWSNFDMVLIETMKCDNKLDAEKMERKYIEDLHATLNNQMPCRLEETLKEYKHNWWINNLEKMHDMKHERYIQNRDEILHKSKNFYEENIDKCKEWKSGVIKCECGNTYTNANRARHLKTKRHLLSSSSSELED